MTTTGLSARHIVITRPTGQAKRLTELVTAQGARPILFPLIAITALEDYSTFEVQLADLAQYDWVIFISSNAVQYGMPGIIKKFGHAPAQVRFAAIGPVTAAELACFGIEDVLVPEQRFDSESLLMLAEMQAVAGKRCMIVRGVGGRELLAETLTARGATVTFAECYRRINPQTDTRALRTLWQNGQLDAMVVTSSEAMRSLLALARADTPTTGQIAPWLQTTRICVNHARIAEEADTEGLDIRVAEAPGDEAMLQCLIKAFSP